MRLFFGIIIGIALTIEGAYVADSMTGAGAARMVNWDVVGEKTSDLTADLRRLWGDFTRQFTGPP